MLTTLLVASSFLLQCGGAFKDVWYGMVEVCEGAPVAVGGWVLTDRHVPGTRGDKGVKTCNVFKYVCCTYWFVALW